MKKFVLMFFVFLTLLTLTACGEDKNADIVTTMFPQYDFARAIAGDKLSVSLLTPQVLNHMSLKRLVKI
jgi:zinc transport system substrate-binding protein